MAPASPTSPVQKLHAAFDPRLLLRPPHQTEQRLEAVVANQRLITLVDLPAAAHRKCGTTVLGLSHHT